MELKRQLAKNLICPDRSCTAKILKEVVFGIEDGMVSTLGSLMGVAVGSGNPQMVVLAGIVIISVESISMGIGSYLSNRSQEEMEREEIKEEKEELKKFPTEEKRELYLTYIKNGWTEELAEKMSEEASQNKRLFLNEMIIHELKINGVIKSLALKSGLAMFFAYILGGIIPLSSFLLLPIHKAIYFSVITTLTGLFILGMSTTKFTKRSTVKSGFRMLIIGGIALFAGVIAGLLIRF
jgi:predicted membrane protein (TIGR00267 family)